MVRLQREEGDDRRTMSPCWGTSSFNNGFKETLGPIPRSIATSAGPKVASLLCGDGPRAARGSYLDRQNASVS